MIVSRDQLIIRSPLRFSSLRSALPLALGLFSLTMMNPTPAALAQEQMLRTLSVTGQGMVTLPATQARITLGVEVQGQTAEEVQVEVARRSNAVVTLLQSRSDITKLQTAGLSLSPVYDYSDNTRRLTGYMGTNTVSFEIPSEQAGALMDATVQSGATRIDSISFTADEESITTAQQQAIENAAQDAQTQADTVLRALGLTRREIIGIQVNGARSMPPMPLYDTRVLQAEAASAPTPVVGGEQEVRASVTLQISY
jgi:uncharacterized protein YggE